MLHFDLAINGQPIGEFSAIRRFGDQDPDSLGEYDVEITAVDGGILRTRWAGRVTHRYGDGGWVLVARALAVAGLDGGAAPDVYASHLSPEDAKAHAAVIVAHHAEYDVDRYALVCACGESWPALREDYDAEIRMHAEHVAECRAQARIAAGTRVSR